MFKNRHNRMTEEDKEMFWFGTICLAATAAVCALAYMAIKADQEETRQALADGRKVINVFGQKAII